jgi:hypothetical protein
MTEISPVADILESVLRLYPDRAGGSLSIKETAHYLHTVHGMGQGNIDSTYEVIRRNMPRLGIKVTQLPGLGKRIWVSALVEAMAKLRDPEVVVPKVSKSSKDGFHSKRLDLTKKKAGQGAGKGGVAVSTVGFITQGDILVANPDGWRWRPQRKIPVVPVRTEFVSELAAVRYQKAEQRSEEFWHGVWHEIDVLRADKRMREGLALAPTKKRVKTHTRRRS